MASINLKKPCDFDTRPDLEKPRQTFELLESYIKNHVDTLQIETKPYTFLSSQRAQIKNQNFDGAKFDRAQPSNEGNCVLETKVTIHPEVIMMTINLREIGITEGRGSYEIKPTQSGFILDIQEVDCFKNSDKEEAHAIKRQIIRNYAVNGSFDWANMTQTLMPDGTIHLAAYKCGNPRLAFPIFNQGSVYSSIPKIGFPPPAEQSFPAFANPCSTAKCLKCGGVRNVGSQTMTRSCAAGTQTSTNCLDLSQEMWDSGCTCDSFSSYD